MVGHHGKEQTLASMEEGALQRELKTEGTIEVTEQE